LSSPPSVENIQRYITEDSIIRGLDDRRNRKRKLVVDNWWNDRNLQIPRKKARWQTLTL
jgi:hypothetical protein